MRASSISAVLGVLAAVSPVRAESISASGSLGGGVIDDDAALVTSAELDATVADELTIGLAARFRFVGGKLARGDWDELRDAGRLLRYLTWRRAVTESISFSLAAGHLGGLTLGHGAIVSGFASGIDFDTARAGADLRARFGAGELHLVVDDVVTAEILSGRLSAPIDAEREIVVAIESVYDRGTGAVLAAAGGDVSKTWDWFGALAYADLASHVGTGGGVHGGAKLSARSERLRLELRGELRYSTAGYVPGWVSPMYLRDRDQLGDSMDAVSLTEHVASRGVRGLSWVAELRGELDSVGSVSASLATRPGLPWQAYARFELPQYRALQLGGWMVYEETGDLAVAAEARARLPRSLFVRAEVARQYSRERSPMTSRWMPLWIATASLGAVVGE